MTAKFNRAGLGYWKLSPRETLIAFGYAISIGYGIVALMVFFRALSAPFLRTEVYIEPWAVIPEFIMVLITIPVMLFGFIELARTLRSRVKDRTLTQEGIPWAMSSIGEGEPF